MSGNDERHIWYNTINDVQDKNCEGIIDVFMHRNRLCAIYHRVMHEFDFHNGYVEVLASNFGISYEDVALNIDTVELTYAGVLRNANIPKKAWFLGFDTAHGYNTPESQTYAAVKLTTKQLADELIEKGI